MARHRSFALGLAAALVMLVGAVAAVAAPAGPAAHKHKPKTWTVQASDFRFCAASAAACSPADTGTTTVKVGDRVTWVYTDHACDAVVPCPGHNVVFSKGGGSSKLVKAQGAKIFTMVFKHAGSYSYFCSAHQSFGMTGTVVVKR